MKNRIIKKIRGFQPTGYNLRRVETQIGDRPNQMLITYYITINNGSTWKTAKDLEMYLGEYNTETREVTFRNHKNQLVTVQKMGRRVVNDYVWAMANDIFKAFKAGDLFRPQYGLGFRK